MTVGFLGLGWMGSNFAGRLVGAGHRVVGFDPVPERLAAAVELGVQAARDGREAAEAGDVALTSLPSSAVFERVAAETLVPAARPGRVFVDLGTTEVSVARRTAGALAERGAALVDAPVSGDPRGDVHVFVGGPPEAVERAMPILRRLAGAKPCVHAGPTGCGQILKGVNQLAMGLVQAAWLETVSYATRQGLDPAVVAEAVGGPDGWRATLAETARSVQNGDPDAFDLKFAEWPYFLNAAREAGIRMPMLEALAAFLEGRSRDRRDNMGRPYAPLWSALHEVGGGAPGPSGT